MCANFGMLLLLLPLTGKLWIQGQQSDEQSRIQCWHNIYTHKYRHTHNTYTHTYMSVQHLKAAPLGFPFGVFRSAQDNLHAAPRVAGRRAGRQWAWHVLLADMIND